MRTGTVPTWAGHGSSWDSWAVPHHPQHPPAELSALRSQLPAEPRRPCPLQDGTLLNSSSRVLPSSVAAIHAALDRGVTVFLATGKARPAAIRAMEAVGLAGEGLVVSTSGPGIFLQGAKPRWFEPSTQKQLVQRRCTAATAVPVRPMAFRCPPSTTPSLLIPPSCPPLLRPHHLWARRPADCGRHAAHGGGPCSLGVCGRPRRAGVRLPGGGVRHTQDAPGAGGAAPQASAVCVCAVAGGVPQGMEELHHRWGCRCCGRQRISGVEKLQHGRGCRCCARRYVSGKGGAAAPLGGCLPARDAWCCMRAQASRQGAAPRWSGRPGGCCTPSLVRWAELACCHVCAQGSAWLPLTHPQVLRAAGVGLLAG